MSGNQQSGIRSLNPMCVRGSLETVCSYCGKVFTRKKSGTGLNPHKNQFGSQCYGRLGYQVF